jgi:teichuronic acid biosynthesis glycosyltransferase TuaC
MSLSQKKNTINLYTEFKIMRVLHITTNYPSKEYPIFGIFVKEQVESLQKEGIDCDVFYCDGHNQGFRRYITYVPRLWWKILTGHYDVLHCHHALSLIILSMTGWPLFKKTVLSYQNDPDREWGRKVFGLFRRYVNAFIFKNRSEYLKYSNTIYLPNGVNQDFFRPMDKEKCRKDLGLETDKYYIMYMDSNKGVRTQKRKDRFDATLDLLNTEYGYEGKVECIALKNTPRELIPTYMNACDLHMISSDFEGSPNSVKECMCCNTPVVSTDVGNVREMIGDIPGAYIVKEFTPKALAEACDKVLKSKEQFSGRDAFLVKGYGMKTVAEKLKGVYENILKKKE